MFYEQLYETWAPSVGIWTPWVKPVLFAQMQKQPMGHAPLGDWRQFDLTWVPRPGDAAVIVVDLPGTESVLMGLALAERGFRPVPLYNCCTGPLPVLDVRGVVDALAEGGEVLRSLALPFDAPPAFLLDSRRDKGDVAPAPGKFDNRWITLPQDFPSATLLQSRGYRQAVVVQHRQYPQDDLAHVLRRWQEGGIAIGQVDPSAGGARTTGLRVQTIKVDRPSSFRAMWYAFMVTMGLRRSSAGGFGGVIPVPSEGGSYHGGFG
jgi:hypothetical protein